MSFSTFCHLQYCRRMLLFRLSYKIHVRSNILERCFRLFYCILPACRPRRPRQPRGRLKRCKALHTSTHISIDLYRTSATIFHIDTKWLNTNRVLTAHRVCSKLLGTRRLSFAHIIVHSVDESECHRRNGPVSLRLRTDSVT